VDPAVRRQAVRTVIAHRVSHAIAIIIAVFSPLARVVIILATNVRMLVLEVCSNLPLDLTLTMFILLSTAQTLTLETSSKTALCSHRTAHLGRSATTAVA